MSLSFLSPFHQVQETTHGALGHHINVFTNLPKLDATNPELIMAVKHGLMLAGENDAMQYFSEGLGGTKNPLFKLPVLGEFANSYSTWLFHDYIPKLKLKTFVALEKENMGRYSDELKSGKVTPSDVTYITAQQVNAAYGHLNYTDIGRNPTLQHFLQATLLAPDFLEARARFAHQAATGVFAKSGRAQLQALAWIGTTFFVAARVLNKTLDDDYHWDHPFEVVYNGRTYSMRSVPEDLFNLFKDTRRFIYGRLSPVIGRGGIEYITGRNYRGEKQTTLDQLKEMATRWIPINVLPFMRDLSTTGKNSPTTPWEQFLSATGLNIKRNSPINDVYSLANDWKKSQGISEDTGTYPISKYQQLRYALEDNSTSRAIDEIKKLAATQDPEKLFNGFRQSLNKPFTGSEINDVRFIHSLGQDDKEKVKAAINQREQVFSRFVNALARSGVVKKQPAGNN
jgi:hypothetical protein